MFPLFVSEEILYNILGFVMEIVLVIIALFVVLSSINNNNNNESMLHAKKAEWKRYNCVLLGTIFA